MKKIPLSVKIAVVLMCLIFAGWGYAARKSNLAAQEAAERDRNTEAAEKYKGASTMNLITMLAFIVLAVIILFVA